MNAQNAVGQFLAVLLGVLAGGCRTPPAAATPVQPAPEVAQPAAPLAWPPLEGWRTETIPFPLGFAPQIPLKGIEELRFAPGFFDPKAPGYFSYAFVWQVSPGSNLSQDEVAKHLHTYFQGLCSAVAKDDALCAPEHHVVKLQPATPELLAKSEGVHAYAGTLDTVDAFKTRSALRLNVSLEVSKCADGQALLLAVASPQARESSLWTSLRAQAAALRC